MDVIIYCFRKNVSLSYISPIASREVTVIRVSGMTNFTACSAHTHTITSSSDMSPMVDVTHRRDGVCVCVCAYHGACVYSVFGTLHPTRCIHPSNPSHSFHGPPVDSSYMCNGSPDPFDTSYPSRLRLCVPRGRVKRDIVVAGPVAQKVYFVQRARPHWTHTSVDLHRRESREL